VERSVIGKLNRLQKALYDKAYAEALTSARKSDSEMRCAVAARGRGIEGARRIAIPGRGEQARHAGPERHGDALDVEEFGAGGEFGGEG
jgi:hypothetical protein